MVDNAARGPRSPRLAGTERDHLTRRLAEKYQHGESLAEISREIGRSAGFVRRLLLDAGVALHPRRGSRRRTS